jgi:2-iminoacetate synthase ThiH
MIGAGHAHSAQSGASTATVMFGHVDAPENRAPGWLAPHPWIRDIQASWVKMGGGSALCLTAGANDLGHLR